MSTKTFLTLLLYISGSLCFSAVEDSVGGSLLPQWLQISASYTRWALLLILFILGPVVNRKGSQSTGPSYRLYLAFYALLSIISILDGDFIRYAGMSLFAFGVPLWISHVVLEIGFAKFLKAMLGATTLLVAIGAYVSLEIKGGTRYTGFADNPNSFALINMFFIAISLMGAFGEQLSKPWRLFSHALFVFCATTELLSASRGGMLGLVILILTSLLFAGIKRSLLFLIGLGCCVTYLLFNHFAADSAERLFNVFEAVSDTGRENLWADAFECINKRPLTGYGTDSRLEMIGSGNAHNTYIALFLFAGYIGGVILSLIYILASTAGVFFQRDAVRAGMGNLNAICSAYLISLASMAFGEDAPLGIGSPWFIYILMAVGIQGAIQCNTNQRRIPRKS